MNKRYMKFICMAMTGACLAGCGQNKQAQLNTASPSDAIPTTAFTVQQADITKHILNIGETEYDITDYIVESDSKDAVANPVVKFTLLTKKLGFKRIDRTGLQPDGSVSEASDKFTEYQSEDGMFLQFEKEGTAYATPNGTSTSSIGFHVKDGILTGSLMDVAFAMGCEHFDVNPGEEEVRYSIQLPK